MEEGEKALELNSAEIERALEPVSEMLQADGYSLGVSVSGGSVDISILAGADACAECLVPRPVIMGIVEDGLSRAGVSLEEREVVVTYPDGLPNTAGS